MREIFSLLLLSQQLWAQPATTATQSATPDDWTSFFLLGGLCLVGLVIYFAWRQSANPLPTDTFFAEVFDELPIPLAVVRLRDNVYVSVNQEFQRLTRCPAAAIIGLTHEQIGFDIEPAALQKFFTRSRSQKRIRNYELVVRFHGQEHLVLISTEQITFGGEACLLGSYQDITARKIAEERFHKAFHANPLPMCIIEDEPHAIVQVNTTFLRYLQLSLSDVQGKRPDELGFKVEQAHSAALTEKIRTTGAVHNYELAIGYQGNEYYLLTNGERMSLAGKGCVLWSFQDITTRKQAEAQLQASEMRYRRLIEDQTEFIVRWLPDGTRTFANDSYCRFFGLTQETALGSPWFSAVYEEDFESLQNQLAALTPAQPVLQVEHRSKQPNGEIAWTHWINRAFFTDDGQIKEFQSVGRDITKRKHAEEIAWRWQMAFTQTAFGMAYANAVENTFIDVNPAYAEARGYTREELIGKPVSLVFPLEKHAELKQILDQTDELGHLICESEHQRKDGSCFPVLLEITTLKDAQGHPTSRIVHAHDLTARKQAEEDLRASEWRYRRLVEDQLDFLVRWLPDGTRTFVNDSYCRFFGLQREKALGTSWFDLAALPPDDPIRQKLQTITPANPIVRWEHQCIAPDGLTAWTDWINRAFFDESGQIIEFQSVGRDITARKQAEEIAQRWHSLFSKTAFGVAHTNVTDNTFLDVNNAYAQARGYTRAELIGQSMHLIYPPGQQAATDKFMAEVDRTGHLIIETVHQRKDGSTFPVLSEITLIRDEQGRAVSRISYSKDITERKRAETKLHASQTQLRNLAGRLQTIREEERRAVAREIHDELGQSLTGIKMELKWLEKLLPLAPEAAHERLAAVYSLIGDTIQNVRRLATSLRPALLDDFGLAAALEWQAREFTQHTGIACDFVASHEDLPLDPTQATALFRIFQETLTNAARHADASEINAQLTYENGILQLQVRDNGKGISPQEIEHNRSLGLLGMRERVLLLGGTLSIAGSPTTGTTITAQIPLATSPQPLPTERAE